MDLYYPAVPDDGIYWENNEAEAGLGSETKNIVF